MTCNTKRFNISNFETLEKFIDHIEEYFLSAIDNAIFKMKKVVIPQHINRDGRNCTFWHCISDGKGPNATFNNERAEKIKFINMLCGCENNCSQFVVKEKEPRFEVVCKKHKYKIILEKRKDFYLLITAFPLYKRKANKYRQKTKTPL